MNYFDKALLLIVIVVFPSLIYLFYVAYYKNVQNEERSISSSIANITTLYLIIKYIQEFIQGTLIFTFIPLIISFNKEKQKDAILLSSILGIYFIYIGKFLLIIPIVLLFLTYKIIKNKKVKYFLYNVIPIIALGSPIYITLIFIFVLFVESIFLDVAEDFIKYHNSYNELLREEEITSSLFKITHEIKNPLAVCVGYLDMLDGADIDKYQKYTKIVESEINRALVILSDFSNLSKITINPDIMNVNVLLEDVVDKIKIIVKEKDININLDLEDDELYINGDYNRLNQVIINILKNAVEAISDKGQIDIISRILDNNIIVEIKDNGSGMSTEILDKINTPFFTTKTCGTGLGVPLSKEIIEKHSGNINYSSKEHNGTKVTITIPAL